MVVKIQQVSGGVITRILLINYSICSLPLHLLHKQSMATVVASLCLSPSLSTCPHSQATESKSLLFSGIEDLSFNTIQEQNALNDLNVQRMKSAEFDMTKPLTHQLVLYKNEHNPAMKTVQTTN